MFSLANMTAVIRQTSRAGSIRRMRGNRLKI